MNRRASSRRDAPPIELRIDDLSHEARGVARHEGKVVFVEDALPGEQVLARITRPGRDFDQAQTLEVLAASPDRVTPRCPHFGVCGGCVLQHLSPTAQIAAKEKQLLENFRRIGGLEPARVLPPLVAEPWAYRRKARLSVKNVAKKEKVLVGFRERQPRFIADLSVCEVLDARIGKRLEAISALVASLGVAESIAQIEVAAGDGMPALVFRHLQPLGAGDAGRLQAFGEREGIAIYLQPGGNDSVHRLWPAEHELVFSLPERGLEYRFLPLDFVQVNARINAAMIEHALALLALKDHERVLDLFCGLGNFTLPLAQVAAHVVGVEGEAGLVQRARDNARRNGLEEKTGFHAADLTQDLRGHEWARQRYDAVLIDPPRTGAQAMLEQLRFPDAQRLLYVSCHPGSLARDARILADLHGFRLSAAGVMDMFPHTAHVESIALFERG
ncbi:23S rRNA (uracil(1939)-C(5))-methyltransferase RlmD [Pseudofulvimonas gallinarii]|uniref:23S rRNA (uracil(1939)-C(5))-methyltransferase RlmD n=1 Tax=Pseudofulvimonas gallinarii TaxID=634155 RepID=A0A4R3LPB9_9GAMM|nr:23S rRNA (uracil(1939)-C(5))-methyltransferase RlmD [Pseudofulvimonas gallinarii]TCT01349.1 23S rRNA m(5)U-1939 methyltransferase [Pseudofulvimonas gallinarii]